LTLFLCISFGSNVVRIWARNSFVFSEVSAAQRPAEISQVELLEEQPLLYFVALDYGSLEAE
jgi:hypothetical protein